jgi:membrane-associated phospholipid phosphatase
MVMARRLLLLGLSCSGFFLYLLINRLPRNEVVAHRIHVGLDGLIPLVPIFSVPYALAMVFVVGTLAYFVLFTPRVRETAYSYTFCLAVSCATYLAFQTTVDRPPVDANSAFTGLVSFIYANDQPYNCFPSLHVSLTVLASLIWARGRRRLAVPLAGWVVLVALSTLFTKQHVLLDVLAGAVLGGASFWVGAALSDP